jgi:serralysin
MVDSAGNGPTLKFGGAAVTVGEFGAFTPIAAEKTASGYDVALRSGSGASAQYVVWTTDSNGNFTGNVTGGVVASGSADLAVFEPLFGQDLDGDGTTGVRLTSTIESAGATTLGQVGNEFVMLDSAGNGATLKFGGAAVTVGEFGSFAPIAAEKTASGYDVALRSGSGSTAQYVVWTTDSNGNFTGNVTGGVVASGSVDLAVFEPLFGQDLDGDGTTGVRLTITIESAGATTLGQVGNEFVMVDSSGNGATLKFGGADVTVGEFGGFAPIAAEKTASGYDVALRSGSGTTAQYVVWTTDSNGNFTGNVTGGVVAGSSADLEVFEPLFGQDLNGDSTTGVRLTSTIESAGATTLGAVGNEFVMLDSSGNGTTLKFGGAAVTVGEFGSFAPIAAEKTASGYDVALRNGTADQYTVWSTDSNGNFTGNLAGGVVAGGSVVFEAFEPIFGQDLNGDHVIGRTDVVLSGSVQTVLAGGTVSNTTVSSGGQEKVSSGGTASNTTVLGGGSETVSSGGVLNGATISGGGLVDIQSGGTAGSSTITISSGTLKLEDSQHFSGSIAGLATSGAQNVDLTDISFAALQTLGYSGNTQSGVLTVTDGTHTAMLNMIGNYTNLSFKPTNDGNGGVQITDPPVSSGSTLAPGH